MRNKIMSILTNRLQIITYAFFGGFGVLSDLLIYWILIINDVNYQFANFYGYLIGTLVSFFLNRQFTFGIKDKIFIRLFKFILVASIGYICSSIILFILIDIFTVDKILSKFITLFFVLILQFTLNKKVTFKI